MLFNYAFQTENNLLRRGGGRRARFRPLPKVCCSMRSMHGEFISGSRSRCGAGPGTHAQSQNQSLPPGAARGYFPGGPGTVTVTVTVTGYLGSSHMP
jgi:hypothetical protein